MSHKLATDNCFWPTGCADRGRCNEFGKCVARWQNEHKRELFDQFEKKPGVSVHNHGNCELCDELERTMSQLREALERYQSLFFGRFGNLEHMSSDEFRAAHLKAYDFAKQVLSGAVRNEKVKYKLVYNKETKRIDKIRNFDGLCVESFDPPEDA